VIAARAGLALAVAVCAGQALRVSGAEASWSAPRVLAAGCALVEEDPAVPKCYLRDPFGLVFNIEQSPLIA